MKVNKFTVLLSAFLLITPSALQAKTTTLFSISNYTWAKSYHGDNYLDYIYNGEVSIRGADRVVHGNDICYPTEVHIYYNVQGKNYHTSVRSTGKNDSVQRKNTITVEDLWNDGDKTQVWGNYTYAPTGQYVSSSGDVE